MRSPHVKAGIATLTLAAALAGSGPAMAKALPSGRTAKSAQLTTTLDGRKVLPLRVRWLAHPPGKASAVADVRFFIDGKLRWIEHGAPYNFGSDDLKGHLGWLVTSWLSPGRHRFTVQARLKDGRKLHDTVVARVIQAPPPPTELAGRWRRTLTDDDLAKVDPRLVGNMPIGVWDRVFDRIGSWDLDPLGTGVVQHVRIRAGTMKVDAPIWMTPVINDQTTLVRYGHRNIAGIYGAVGGCRDDGPVATYRWSVANNQLTLTPTDDACLLRKAVWTGTWTRVG